MRSPVLPVLALVLATSTAMASQVHYEQTELEALIEGSELIVVARVLDPARTIVDVPITPKMKAKDPDKYPDYRAVVLHFTVVENLYSREKIELPSRLNVVHATLGQSYDLHRRYHVDGMSKSPIYRRYEAKGDPIKLEPGSEVILFLRAPSLETNTPLAKALKPTAPSYQLVVDGAFERMAMKKEIQARLEKRAR